MSEMSRNILSGAFSSAQEDIIWAMGHRNEKNSTLRNIISYTKKRSSISLQTDNSNYLIASMVPDEVIKTVIDGSPKPYMGCILCGDIKGFDEVMEICSQPGNGGATRMTEILNKFMGAIVKDVISYEGDILKFSAHSFLVQWKHDKISPIRHFTRSAINCALVIQKNFSNVKLDISMNIQVKLTIAVGLLNFVLIDDGISSNFICIGRPLNQIKKAEDKTDYGEIVVMPSAWNYVNKSEYAAKETEDSHFKVFGIGPNWKREMKNHSERSEKAQVEEKQSFNYEDNDSEEDEECFDDSSDCEIRATILRSAERSIRPMIKRARNLQSELSRFIAPPVLNALTCEEPIQSLNEMRQIVVMSINISVKQTDVTSTIRVIDDCYKLISRRARDYKGTVDSVSFVDEHISFKQIFGLRGFTCVTECENALICSAKCQQELNSIKEVQSVSIACTTGMAFCGIFGDHSRREYTAVGFCVLQASKMISAYPDKITCDRKTFHYSRINAKQFASMAYQKLVGEPIYQYKRKREIESRPSCDTLKPMLGRDREIETFRKLFHVFSRNFGIRPKASRTNSRCSYKSCLVVEGKTKRGKTRFLNEVDVLVDDANVYKIRTEMNHDMIPYEGIRSIFGFGLKFQKFTLTFRRQKLEKLLNKFEDTSLLCALNSIFDVNFPITDKYTNNRDKRGVVNKLLKYLCEKQFTKTTLISIDNAELLDQGSWDLLITLLDTKRFFLVLTVNSDKYDLHHIGKIVKSFHTETICLDKLGKVYQGALVCQLLEVFALSADLEKMVQNNSDGNPGWIENFLITAMQAKKIFIQKIDYKLIYEEGLVTPPLYLIKRLSPKEKLEYESILKREASDDKDLIKQIRTDQWGVYVDSSREKSRAVKVKTAIYERFLKASIIPVCEATEGLIVSSDVEPDVSDDMNVLEMFDKMSYREQHLLKCASILGDPFTRRILFYIWNPKDPKEAAVDIRKLFEKGIICCARGDFRAGGEYVLIRQKTKIDPTANQKIACYCIDVDIHDTCSLLPKYASCGYMRFRCNKFRSNMYKSIPYTERKDLHIKAAEFLQTETRRCLSCGCSYFSPNIACRLDSTPHGRLSTKYRRKNSFDLNPAMDFEELIGYSAKQHFRSLNSSLLDGEHVIRHSIFQKSVLENSINSKMSLSTLGSTLSTYEMFKFEEDYNMTKIKFVKTPNFISPFTIRKLKNSVSLVRTFSRADFVSCECHLILGHMFKRLIQHFSGSEQWHHMVVSTLHYIKICINSKNFADALKTSKETLGILKEKEQQITIPKWQLNNLIGKLYSLQGVVYMRLDQLDVAKSKFLDSLTALGENFPENEINVRYQLKLLGKKLKQMIGLYFFPKILLDNEEDIDQLNVKNSVSDSLTHLCNIYMIKGQWKLAELAATWSLRNSLRTETSLIRICDSFTNMMKIAVHYKKKFLLSTLEIHALRYCHKKRNSVEPPELKSVARLYEAIFQARISRIDYEGAIKIGFIVNQISVASNEINTTIRVLSSLVFLLLEQLYIQQATSTMHELECFIDEVDDNFGKLWYYSTAIHFHLETGYVLIPFHKIELFFNEENVKACKYFDVKMRLILGMWLWYLRNDRMEEASILKKEVNSFRYIKINNNFNAVTSLYLLEGTLLGFVDKINMRSLTGKAEARKEVERLFKKLKRYTSFSSLISGRLLHLNAYYYYILDIEEKKEHFIAECRKFCNKYKNKLELKHLEHSEKAWKNELSSPVRNFWVNHCSISNNLTNLELNFEDLKLYSYTYPRPLFVN